jgi:IS5 family transposase
MPQPSSIDIDRRLESISRMGDPLERLAAEIPWELFRPLLEKVHEKERKSAAGRKPLDVVLMFKILILQSLYNLADEAIEYQIRDRLSLMRFLGLQLCDNVPDCTTVWRFRERLKELELIKPLFDRFGDYLAQAGLQARNGQIIDASIVRAPDPAQQPR